MKKVAFPLSTFLPIGLTQNGGGVNMTEQVPGTLYQVRKFASSYDMYNNINPIISYDADIFPVNALPVSAGQYVRATISRSGYETAEETLVAI